MKPRAMPRAETEREEKAASNQIARLDPVSQKAFIGLTVPELDEEEMMASSFTQIRSSIAGLRQASARDPNEAGARCYRLREARRE